MKIVVEMEARLKKLAPPLTTKEAVANFLGVSERTINRYIEQGYLKNNIHFYRKSDRIIVFIEDAVIKFRDERDKGVA